MDFFFDGTSVKSLGFTPSIDMDLTPAQPNITWDEPAYGTPVDTSEFVTGQPSYSVSDDNYIDLVTDPSKKEELWRWALTELHGQSVEMACDRRSYNGELARWHGRCTVSDVSPVPDTHDVIRVTWERGPWLSYADGEVSTEPVSAEWELGPFGEGTSALLTEYSDFADPFPLASNVGWPYTLVEEVPNGSVWQVTQLAISGETTEPYAQECGDAESEAEARSAGLAAAERMATLYACNVVARLDDWSETVGPDFSDTQVGTEINTRDYAVPEPGVYWTYFNWQDRDTQEWMWEYAVGYFPAVTSLSGQHETHMTITRIYQTGTWGDEKFDYSPYYILENGLMREAQQGDEFTYGYIYTESDPVNVPLMVQEEIKWADYFYGTYEDLSTMFIVDNRTVKPSSLSISCPFSVKLHDAEGNYEDVELPEGGGMVEWNTKNLHEVDVTVSYQPDVYTEMDEDDFEEAGDDEGRDVYSDVYAPHPLYYSTTWDVEEDGTVIEREGTIVTDPDLLSAYWASDDGIEPFPERYPAWEKGRTLVDTDTMNLLSGYKGPFEEGSFSYKETTVTIDASWERADV